MRLADKVAIITGSASGMGRYAAELFASEGASVVITDIAEKEGQEIARAIRDHGGKAIFVKANVANEDEVKHMVNAAIDAFGRVDVLYNNAGIMPAEDGSVTDISEATWDKIMDISLQRWYVVAHQILRRAIWPSWHTLQCNLPWPYRDSTVASPLDE